MRVLGTLRDGTAQAATSIIVKVSDPPGRRDIRVGGGIWSGIPGSPVYILGTLAGAISYSSSDGPSAHRRKDACPLHGAAPGGAAACRRIPRRARRRIPRRLRRPEPSRGPVDGPRVRSQGVGGDRRRASRRRSLALRRLGIPAAVSGAVGTAGPSSPDSCGASSAACVWSRRGRHGVQRHRAATLPRAGQNLAGVIARGDVTVAAVGTVTGVCHGRVTAFGHPMTGDGAVAYAAARARTVAIVDGADPYKLANIGRTFSLDVDRLTGVRALAGWRLARWPPITARAVAVDRADQDRSHPSVIAGLDDDGGRRPPAL
ncbi:MAG: hypothetical protein R3C32_10605 [Chloroflexota bacterium]